MSQYSTGLSSVTNGSATVTGTNTLWLANVTAGDSFTVAGDGVMYDVASVDSDTQITLSVNYAGTTASGAVYAIGTGFTVPDSFPEMSQGDIETATIFTRAMRKIQSRFTGLVSDISGKADQATTYTETEVDGLLNTKADQANTYTETEVDNLLNAKASLSGATFSGPIGIGITPNGVLNNGKSLALGDSDTGIRQNGDGVLEIISNSETVVTIDKASGITGKNLSGTNTGDQDLREVGVGQTWQDLSGSRSAGITYTNSTGKPIGISIDQSGDGKVSLSIDGIQAARMEGISGASLTLSSIVPVGAEYRVIGASVSSWFELR